MASTLPKAAELSWRPLNKEEQGKRGISIEIRSDPTALPGAAMDGERFRLDLGTRDGELTGCVASDLSTDKLVTSARCRLENGWLIVTMGSDAGSIRCNLSRQAEKGIAGPAIMEASALPGGRLHVGEAELAGIE